MGFCTYLYSRHAHTTHGWFATSAIQRANSCAAFVATNYSIWTSCSVSGYTFALPPACSVEEEATRIQQERLTAEEENRTLRETVFESQGRARAAEAALKKIQAEAADRDKQLRIMTDQNAELLRLLEEEEAQTSRLSAANEVGNLAMLSGQ